MYHPAEGAGQQLADEDTAAQIAEILSEYHPGAKTLSDMEAGLAPVRLLQVLRIMQAANLSEIAAVPATLN